MKRRGINFSLLGTIAMILGVVIKIMDDIVMNRNMERMIKHEVNEQLKDFKHKIN